jgi:hypothetical protein
MSLLQNAVDSVALGIEDFQSADDRRLISSVRNITAGILLLFKHKLAELSPTGSDEILIKEEITPFLDSTGSVQWKGKGQKTVNVTQIEQRFKGLGISVDWARFTKINKHRNTIEHYYSKEPRAVVKEVIASSFLIIRDFARDVLKDDPLNVFGDETWNVLVKEADVYSKEKQECVKNIRAINWQYKELRRALEEFSCPECASDLLDAQSVNGDQSSAKLVCRACGEPQEWETVAGDAIGNYFGGANHLSVKDGGEPLTMDCPNCNQETYLVDRDICVICQDSVPDTCDVCGNTIPTSERDGGSICGWCSHMADKD